MRLALLVIAMAGCGFRSPGSSKPGVDAAVDDLDAAVDADANPDVDAAVKIDAPAGFDPATCPPSYDVTLPGFPQARYRIITGNAVFQSQHTACTVAGLSHLVALETALELTELGTVLLPLTGPPTNGWYYVGAVQRPGQTAPDAEWFWLVGGTVSSAAWGLFTTVVQPNDADDSEDNSENLAVIDRAQGKLLDVTGTNGYGAVCECDGKSIIPTIAAYIP